MTKRAGYFSYLLRVWRTGEREEDTWRASLEQPGTHRRRGFATLDELFDFLQSQTIRQPEPSGQDVED